MSFLDKIGKTISDAGQGVAQSTKNFADVTKLNGMISDEEKKIAVLYSNIGKAYYAQHKDDPNAEVIESITAVNECFKAIEQYKEQITQIKQSKQQAKGGVCENCGAAISENASFCTSCGTPVVRRQEQPANNAAAGACPNCGKPIAQGSKFCTGCGSKL